MIIMNLGNGKINELIYTNESNKYYISDETIDSAFTNNSHSLIASQIKENSIVLDVGCAQGIIGNYLYKNKNCKVYGIEIDDISRKIAENQKNYVKIFDFSIEKKDNIDYINFFKEKNKFDYIIFADILEHLVNPGDVL